MASIALFKPPVLIFLTLTIKDDQNGDSKGWLSTAH